MSLLGSVGQIYMLALLTLLFLSFGFAIWSAINHFAGRSSKKAEAAKANSNKNLAKNETQSNKKLFGGIIMGNNGWLKLAVFSFVGILISFAVLGLLTSNGMTAGNYQMQNQQMAMNANGMNNMQAGNMQIQQGNMNMNNNQMQNQQMVMNANGMNNMQAPGMQGGMQMNNMQAPGMQGGMPMNNMQMPGMQMNNMPSNMNAGGNDMMMMLQNMQMQMNQMQQQINMMGNSGSMSNGSMSGGSMSGGSSGGSSGGGMGMMGGMM